jgi:hypothetical protein
MNVEWALAADAWRYALSVLNTMDNLYKKLDGWMDILDNQVRSLRTNQHIFWEVQKIIRGNPRIDKPNDFYGWMAEMYAAAMSVAIRKLADNDARTISFRRLLEEIKANPSVISRTRFKKLFVDRNYTECDADEGFDQLIGAGREFINTSDLDDEIQTLISKTAKLRKYVNKRIAHHDKSPFNDLPTFKELDDAIAYIEKLLQRYWLIFRCMSMYSALPTWQYDWKEVFYYPWIDKGQH